MAQGQAHDQAWTIRVMTGVMLKILGGKKALSKLRWLCWEEEHPVHLGAPQGEWIQQKRDMQPRNGEKGVPMTGPTPGSSHA